MFGIGRSLLTRSLFLSYGPTYSVHGFSTAQARPLKPSWGSWVLCLPLPAHVPLGRFCSSRGFLPRKNCGCNRSLPAIVRVRAWSYAICCPCFLRRSVSLSLRGTHAGTPYLPALLAFGRFSFGRCGAYFRETSRAVFPAFGVFSFLNMSKSAFFYSQRVASFAAHRAVKNVQSTENAKPRALCRCTWCANRQKNGTPFAACVPCQKGVPRCG